VVNHAQATGYCLVVDVAERRRRRKMSCPGKQIKSDIRLSGPGRAKASREAVAAANEFVERTMEELRLDSMSEEWLRAAALKAAAARGFALAPDKAAPLSMRTGAVGHNVIGHRTMGPRPEALPCQKLLVLGVRVRVIVIIILCIGQSARKAACMLAAVRRASDIVQLIALKPDSDPADFKIAPELLQMGSSLN